RKPPEHLDDVEHREQNQTNRPPPNPDHPKPPRSPTAPTSAHHHYAPPAPPTHRHKLQGVVHRTSSTGETVFIEPAGVASLSAEREVLKGDEDREIRRILRRLSADVGKVARQLTHAIDLMARLDLITAQARYSHDYNIYPP